jgi:hypothetical protein
MLWARGASRSAATGPGTVLPCRLVAHTALQPGTATVFREVMRPGADAAQLSWCEIGPGLAGSRFRDAPAKFPDDAVVGVLTGADGRLLLNPSDSLQLHLGDRLVGLTRRSEHGWLWTSKCALLQWQAACMPV